jgi:hypothetical protein
MSKSKKIKPQRGITYECYAGFTDITDTRARRGRRYVFLADSFRDDWFMFPASNKGIAVMVPKEKFASHFIPLNPLDAHYIPND